MMVVQKIRELISNAQFRLSKEGYWKKRLIYLNKYGNWRNQQKIEIIPDNIFIPLCKEIKDNNCMVFSDINVLEIGCGNGMYTKLLSNLGIKKYIGIDITDVLFSELMQKFSDYLFIKMDITIQYPSQKFDLIIMLDVTQHITSDNLFFKAMENVKYCLNDNGVFMVTSWLNRNINTYYEKSRTLEYYLEIFKGYNINIYPFSNKFILVISK